MVTPKREADWTPEHVRRFWDYYASRPDLRGTYFSLQVGAGMTRFLNKAGVLRGNVLDYGCGLGFLAAEMLKLGVQCWGCDGSTEAVLATNRMLQGTPGWRGASSTFTDGTSFRSVRFDLVTCIETVEHLTREDSEKVISDIRSLLRPGGSLFVTTPNDEDLTHSMLYCPFCDAEFHGMQHITSFTRDTLSKLLTDAGFSVVFAGAVDFRELQAPIVPSLLDLSPRAVLRSARSIFYESYDRLAGRRFPSSFEGRARTAKFPHLCAIALKRDGEPG
jgi:2-polyprenyl-3-methyl-5-hydroxy-6-metoxy-1,4-benzoquinol methylase